MDATELRAIQAPLKERYREDPASAVVTLRAERYCVVNQTLANPPRLGMRISAT